MQHTTGEEDTTPHHMAPQETLVPSPPHHRQTPHHNHHERTCRYDPHRIVLLAHRLSEIGEIVLRVEGVRAVDGDVEHAEKKGRPADPFVEEDERRERDAGEGGDQVAAGDEEHDQGELEKRDQRRKR